MYYYHDANFGCLTFCSGCQQQNMPRRMPKRRARQQKASIDHMHACMRWSGIIFPWALICNNRFIELIGWGWTHVILQTLQADNSCPGYLVELSGVMVNVYLMSTVNGTTIVYQSSNPLSDIFTESSIPPSPSSKACFCAMFVA